MVAGVTGAGRGDYSNHLDERTYGDVPAAVVAMVTLRLECPSSVLVQWNAPDVKLLHSSPEDIMYTIAYNEMSEEISYLSNRETITTVSVCIRALEAVCVPGDNHHCKCVY